MTDKIDKMVPTEVPIEEYEKRVAEPKTGWNSHRWSGWPGAWCLDCGVEDPVEAMINDPDHIIDYDEMPDGSLVDKSYFATPEAEARWKEACEYSCPEPGSNRFNPYTKANAPSLSDVIEEINIEVESITTATRKENNDDAMATKTPAPNGSAQGR
jgi:hypothetical protein